MGQVLAAAALAGADPEIAALAAGDLEEMAPVEAMGAAVPEAEAALAAITHRLSCEPTHRTSVNCTK